MWLLFARAQPSNAPYWPGRRWLAVVDAVTWPAALAIALHAAPLDGGIVQSVLLALCSLSAIRRCALAIWRNERYRFTTWQLGRPLALLMALGALLKLAA